MQTYSHFLMTALAGDRLKRRQVQVHTKALLVGSVLPDLALFGLTAWYIAYFRWFAPAAEQQTQLFGDRYDEYYFHNPIWIVGHNLFHAPLILATLGFIGYWAARRGSKWGWPLVWLMVGCGFHTVVDIFTHYDDGPLVFFPFNWSWRFQAPVSYWDPQHGGRLFAPLELLLNVLILVYFGVGWLRRRAARAPVDS